MSCSTPGSMTFVEFGLEETSIRTPWEVAQSFQRDELGTEKTFREATSAGHLRGSFGSSDHGMIDNLAR